MLRSSRAFRIMSIHLFILGLFFSYSASAAVLGDIDNDGKITLKEAIYALQVVGGIKEPPPPLGAKSARVPNGASFDFSSETVDLSGQNGDFRFQNHYIIGLAAPSGISWWTGDLSTFENYLDNPTYIAPPEGYTPGSSTQNSAGKWLRWLKTTEGRYAMIFSVAESNEKFDFYFVYPYGNFTWSDAQEPLPPASISAVSAGEGSLLVTWQPSPSSDVCGYWVNYGTSQYGYSSKHCGDTTSYTLTSLTPGQTYFISVTAYDLEGNKSETSSQVTVTP